MVWDGTHSCLPLQARRLCCSLPLPSQVFCRQFGPLWALPGHLTAAVVTLLWPWCRVCQAEQHIA